MSNNKPLHARPAFYTLAYEQMKQLAKEHGWALLLHGSICRDLDLVLIPWATWLTKTHEELILQFTETLGGALIPPDRDGFAKVHHGRLNYVINLHRGGTKADGEYIEDPQYYIDISVIAIADYTKCLIKIPAQEGGQDEK